MNDQNLLSVELNSDYSITNSDKQYFEIFGFLKLSNVLSENVLQYFSNEITKKVFELNNIHKIPLEKRTTYDRAFLQVVNLWKHSETIKRLVFSKKLSKIATALLDVKSVRLYHDQALYKEPSGGFTPWHADQYYWPMKSDKCLTAWIPLQKTSLEMGPLEFAEKSHLISDARDIGISDESEIRIEKMLNENKSKIFREAFNAGDISFHKGWTFHRAGANSTTIPRKVMTIIYMDGEMRLNSPQNENQALDAAAFCAGVNEGEIIDSGLNPIL